LPAPAHSFARAWSLPQGAGSVSSRHFFTSTANVTHDLFLLLTIAGTRDKTGGLKGRNSHVGPGLKPPVNAPLAGKTLHPGTKTKGQAGKPAYPQPIMETDDGIRITQYPIPRPVMGPSPNGPVPSSPGIFLTVLSRHLH
jgi:hypothetical protein